MSQPGSIKIGQYLEMKMHTSTYPWIIVITEDEIVTVESFCDPLGIPVPCLVGFRLWKVDGVNKTQLNDNDVLGVGFEPISCRGKMLPQL